MKARGISIKGKHISMALLIFFSIFMIFPFFWLLRSSFMSQREIMTMPIKWLPSNFNFDNYRNAMKSAPFAVYFRNSIILVVVNVSTQIISASFAGFGFARLTFRLKGFWFGLLLSTLMIPGTVLMIPQFILWKSVGATNTFLPLMLPWLFGHPFNIFLVRQFYMGIPRDYDEAALVDGANYFTIYRKVLMPLSMPVLCSIGVFTFIGQYRSQMNYLMAASLVAVIPMIVIFFFAQRYFIEGITFSGLKG